MNGIHELLERWNPAEREQLAVATLLSARGHSYRKQGAVMLFGPNGPVAGSLSPGCMEADLAGHAALVLEEGTASTVTYDMSSEEDPLWGETSFCGGSVSVLLEPLEGHLKDALLQLKYWLSQGLATEMIRIFDNRGRVQAYRLNLQGGTSRRFGSVIRSFWTWSTLYFPRPRLILFGAGPDSRPVAELAGRAGFHVIASDWRDIAEDVAAAACERVNAPLSSILNEAGLRPGDRILLMSHQYRQDREILEQLIPLPVRYIGILGSKTRVARLLEGLADLPDPRIHGPVGLPIGAAGPEQIAISIVGELIQDRSLEMAELAAAKTAPNEQMTGRGRS
ncbi:MAG: XdhC/CoxI family protein [Paenibacillaceae bacterium]|nr:XdhC/CoxI family protein [Paenibacillaceae bacterium]